MPLKLASLRLAPVQAATWGHPETTGLPTVDYYLSAEYLEPAGAEENYTEHLIKLPGLGVCYEALPVPEIEVDLAKLGIERSRPILLNPGTSFKFSPHYDWVYVAIARRLGDCQLIFFTGRETLLADKVRQRIERAFRASGMDGSRYVRFLPWLTRADFHGLMRKADVFLDPIGFSGFNTAIQAVECGLPIVTREGRFMRGRLAGAVLERMGVGELVVKTEEQYVELAVKLASDADYRERVRGRLRERLGALYNDIAPVRALEGFLEQVVRKNSKACSESL
jgi:predicted O-linked N-acetylglucosamine transferase (SPINDLY family)